MADIQMRFHKDVLALTTPLTPVLVRQGFDVGEREQSLAQAHFVEEDTLREGYRLLCASMAPCVVTETSRFLPACLAHVNLSEKLPDLACVALSIVNSFKPQHVLVELGECGLPLDPSSKTCLLEHRSQYERAGRAFEGASGGGSAYESASNSFDAFLLSGFTSTTTLKCALMGLAKVSNKPIFASVNVDENGNLCKMDTVGYGQDTMDYSQKHAPAPNVPATESSAPATEVFATHETPVASESSTAPETLSSALDVMAEYGTSVIGFRTNASLDAVVRMAKYAINTYNLPVLVEIVAGSESHNSTRSKAVSSAISKQNIRSSYTNPHSMFELSARLQSVGVQFLRATGNATPAFASALAASCAGVDVVRNQS